MRFNLVILLTIGLISNLAFGQPSDTATIYSLSLEELSKIEVYSTQRITSQKVQDASANVLVITSQQIMGRGYNSLIQLFDDLPDFKIDRAVDPRWQNDITIRGIRYLDKIIILLDGVRITSPTNEIISFFENYPLYMAKQVEIVYGPASALYGADAFAGVVNIITKDQNDIGLIGGKVNYGMYNMVSADLMYSQSFFEDKLEVTLGGSFFYDQQPDLAEFYDDYEGRDSVLNSQDFDAPVSSEAAFPLEAYSHFAKLTYGNFTLLQFGNHAQSPSSTANDPEFSIYNEDQFFGHKINLVTGRFQKQYGSSIVRSQLTYNSYRLDNESNFRNAFTGLEPAYLYAKSWKLKFEQLLTYQLNDHISLTGGVTLEQFFSRPRSNNLEFPIESNDIGPAVLAGTIADQNPDGLAAELITTRYGNIGGLFQVSVTNRQLEATMGARIDRDDRFKPTINPRLALILKPNEKLSVKLLAGSAFLAPSPQNIYDRYGTLETIDDGQTYTVPGLYNLPNTSLRPQTIATGEIGLGYFFTDNFKINGTVYISDLRNLISPVNNSDSSAGANIVNNLYPSGTYEFDGMVVPINVIQVNANLGESFIHGGNIGLDYNFVFGNWGGKISSSYSLVNGSIDIDEEGSQPERNLPGVSQGIFRIGTTLRKGQSSIYLAYSIVGDQRTFGVNSVQASNPTQYQEIDGYHFLNAFFKRRISSNISVTLEARNLLDKRYRNINIGANPENASGGGSSAIEFQNGAPQNPIRIIGGITFSF